MLFLSIIVVLCVLCSVVQSESFRVCTLGPVGKEPADNCSFPVCTVQESGLEVPSELCDDSLCHEAPLPDFTEFGKLYKYYKWNSESEIVGLDCPFIPASMESSPEALQLVTYTRSSGINCSDVTKFISSDATITDFYRGKLHILKYEKSGEVWSRCRPYSVPGGPYIMRTCRTSPPPPPGKAFASIHLAIPADDNPESDVNLQKFLDNYVVEWQQNRVKCF